METAGNIGGLSAGEVTPHAAGDRIPRAAGGFPPPRGCAPSGKIILSAIAVLFTVVLLILFVHLYIRWHLLRLANRRRNGRLVFAPGRRSVAARGLDPEALQSLPVLVFSFTEADEGADKVVECAVCLSEFVEGEKVRELRRCDHRFHIECIDMWFRSHSTCPLCRSAVEAVKKPPSAGDGDAAESTEATQVALPAADLGSSTGDGIGNTLSAPGETELRIGVPARGSEQDAAEQSGLKSPVGPVSAIRRLLSGDLRLNLGGGSSEEPDLERGEAAERSPPTL